jgi:hypothetical protein
MDGRRARLDRPAALVVVVVSHSVIVFLLLRVDSLQRLIVYRRLASESLILLDLSRIQEAGRMTSPQAPPTPATRERTKSRSQPMLTDVDRDASRDQQQSNVGRDQSELESPKDWYGDAALVAKSLAPDLWKELTRRCREAERRHEHPPECHHYRTPEPWRPEVKKYGLYGPFPYFTLGERCVIGLGFFGCGLGKLAEANGHLLDDMRDPDRPRSSVPDNGGSQQPAEREPME